MGCASAKHVSTVQNEEDTQNGKNYQNGDAFCGKCLPINLSGGFISCPCSVYSH